MERVNKYIDQLAQLTVSFAPKLLLAALVFVVGWWLTNRIAKVVSKALEKTQGASSEVKHFLGSMVSMGLKVLLVISAAGILGIETTSFVGIIAAMGFAVGLALQGNLSNFAAGVLIMLMHPIKVGDEVNIQGNWASVKEIQIFNTILENFDGSLTIISNSTVVGGSIRNYSTSANRHVAVALNVPYSEDLMKVKRILIDAGHSVPGVDKTKEPFFWIQSFGDHFIKISLYFYAQTQGFWTTDTAVKEAILQALNANRIQVAYPTGVVVGEFGRLPEAEPVGAQHSTAGF